MQRIRIDKEEYFRLREELDSKDRVICCIKEKFEASEKENAVYKNTISELKETILNLESQVCYLKRRLWGKSSERMANPGRFCLHLFDDPELSREEQQAAEDAVKEIESFREKTVKIKLKAKPVRKALPDSLPRREEHIYPAVSEGEAFDELPPEITEILEHEPGKCYVRKIIRHKYVLKTRTEGPGSPVVTAPLPALPLPRSYAGATLLSELTINKYVDHLPFYRQIQMFKRYGLSLSASTVNGWFKETTDLLRPMYFRLKELVLASDYIQADETTIPVIIHEQKQAVKGYLWLFRSVEDSQVFFHYDHGSRAQKVIVPLLSSFKGALQTDGYEAYAGYDSKEGVLHLGCWAHARRKFVEATASDRERAEYALSQIGLLYAVERKADEDNITCEERAALRQRLSRPIIAALEKWLLREYPKVLPKSPIGKAISYTFNIYPRLKRYLSDGRFKIDNNLIENSVRPVALGRKNFLFCGNHSAAEDAAVIYSLMGCCKASGVNFRKWLEFVLNNIHSYDYDYSRDLKELLPRYWRDDNRIRTVS